MGGIPLTSGQLTRRGFAHDRRFMLVRPDGVFLTQREFPIMALFSLSIENDGFVVKFGHNSLHIPLDGEKWQTRPATVQVFSKKMTAYLAPDSINAWFSEQINTPCSLAYMPEKCRRMASKHYAGNHQWVSFADGYPILLANAASLDDLQGRQSNFPIQMNRFRPNIVVSGANPWEEDTWKNFTVGGLDFLCAKPCARCLIVNTDQATATRSPEVLKTLAEFRLKDKKVLFGINLVWKNYQKYKNARIEVGQEIRLHDFS